MCGIFGLIHKHPLTQEAVEKGKAANRLLSHRGPDGEGVWVDQTGRVLLAHRRLAVIDLDPRSSQPMHRDGLSLTFNGEIYNYLELKQELIPLGHVFHTESDTEVILAAYQEWGEACLERFDGMFAFLLWDEHRQSLWFARDPFGEKPLYWANLDEGFYFASEIKSIRHMKSLSADEDEEKIIAYLYDGFFRPPHTFYRNVYILPPGYQGWIHRDFSVTTQPYDQLQQIHSTVSPYADFQEAVEDAHRILRDSITKRLRADVPVGVFLSGGIDSSLVAALAHEVQPDLTCYTVSFPGTKEDESQHAMKVARHLGVKHEVIPCPHEQVQDLIECALRLYDQPNASWGVLPHLPLYRETAKRVTVAVSGQGGDELFFGYGKYSYLHRYRHWLSLPYPLRRSFAACAKWLWGPKRASSFSGLIGVRDRANAHWMVRNHEAMHALFSHLPQPVNPMVRELLHQGYDLPRASRMYDILATQPEVLIASIDRASMHHSLEVRTPFLQRELFRCAERVSFLDHTANHKPKNILRHILQHYYPPDFFTRKKQGFIPPFGQWIRDGALDDYLHPNRLHWVTPSMLLQLRQEHQSGRYDHSGILYRIASYNAFVS